jgi:hypothetical protein
MKILKIILVFVCLAFTGTLLAQDPDLPPDDGSGEELDTPLSGSEIFFVVALGVGGILIYKHQSSVGKKLNESAKTKP